MTDGQEQITNAKRLPEVLEADMWDGGVKIVLQGSMRAVAKRGSMDLKSGWRADVFYGKGRKPAFVLVADTPEKVLSDLGKMTKPVDGDQ
jgi:hypothetical protein